MDGKKRRALEKAGWVAGSAADFLELSEEEAALVEMKTSLSAHVKAWRTRAKMSQEALAKRLKSSQSRVAKIEAGDPSVSLDLLVKASVAAGAKPTEVAKALVPTRGLAAG
ncbi:MAG: helix-turn-helix transcriptional regulator [Gemmatimonadaceae bacterium]